MGSRMGSSCLLKKTPCNASHWDPIEPTYSRYALQCLPHLHNNFSNHSLPFFTPIQALVRGFSASIALMCHY